MPAAAAPAAPRARAALPAFFEFDAPDTWRAIDFISDLHLGEATPRTFEAWVAYLRQTPADAVIILGDLFELWVGDDMRTRDFESRCVQALRQAADTRQLGFMVGNRDFLLGAEMRRESRLVELPDPTLLTAWGQRVLLSHGDALCLADAPYQAFRQEVRRPAWQAAFLARPLSERLAIAAEVRRASDTRRRFDGDAATDVDADEALRWMKAVGASTLVHGHTHRPRSQMLAEGFERHVLSDWDLDTGSRAEVLRLAPQGFSRWPLAALVTG
jgi:UDP-2,3-diacylglucosamine hydrolase